MPRRIALALLSALLIAAPAWAQGASDRKQAVDEKISRLREKIEQANHREGGLTSEI